MTFTVRDISERYGVGLHTVLAWIHSGELRAINVGRTASGKKARWRVTEEALSAFELRRSSTPPPKPVRRSRRTSHVIERY